MATDTQEIDDLVDRLLNPSHYITNGLTHRRHLDRDPYPPVIQRRRSRRLNTDEGPSVPLSGSLRGNLHELIFREAPAKDHTIPHDVIAHVELDAYVPWDDQRWGWSSWPGAGPRRDVELTDIERKRANLKRRAEKLLAKIAEASRNGN